MQDKLQNGLARTILNHFRRFWLYYPCILVAIVWACIPGPWSQFSGKGAQNLQVLGNDKELWVFLEIGWGVSGPPPFTIAREHYVFHHEGGKWQPPVKIGTKLGMHFSKNITRIARLENKFYGFQSDERGSVYVWTGEEFKELEDKDAEKLKHAHGFRSDMTLGEYWKQIDVVTRKSGWDVLYRDDFMGVDENPLESALCFCWNGRQLVIVKAETNNLKSQRISIVELTDKEAVPHELITFDRDMRYMSYMEKLWLEATLK